MESGLHHVRQVRSKYLCTGKAAVIDNKRGMLTFSCITISNTCYVCKSEIRGDLFVTYKSYPDANAYTSGRAVFYLGPTATVS